MPCLVLARAPAVALMIMVRAKVAITAKVAILRAMLAVAIGTVCRTQQASEATVPV